MFEHLTARLGLDDRAFSRGMRGAERTTRRFQRLMAGLGIGLSVAGLTRMASRAANMAQELIQNARAIDSNVEELQRLREAEERTVRTSGLLEDRMQSLGRRAVANEDKFRAMGIEVRNTDGSFISVRDLLDEVANAIQGAESQAEKLNIAQETMGATARRLVPLLDQGSEGIRKLGETANIMDQETAEALDNARNSIRQFSDDSTIAIGRLAAKALEARDALREMFDARQHASEVRDEERDARREAMQRLADRGELPTVGGRPGLPGPFSRDRAEALRKVEEETNAVLGERIRLRLEEQRHLQEIEAHQEGIRKQEEEAASNERRARTTAEERARKQSEILDFAKQLAQTTKEARQERELNELPVAERLVELEKEQERLMRRAMSVDFPEEQREEAMKRLLELDDRIHDAQREKAREMVRIEEERTAAVRRRSDIENALHRMATRDIAGFSLADIAREGRGDIGFFARRAQDLRGEARAAAMGGSREFAERLLRQAEELEARLPEGLMEDPAEALKKALHDTNDILDRIEDNTDLYGSNLPGGKN